eukprot:TRINITY_DN18863_c0_g1_i4.p1 TRINITY_DN18863_c0_g1~~TRINITY_DN18863_c0_g1_i4.p1  ORF type:complete len:393 (+),score=97.87 TRINITY_DN18863_c0_g1_i4:133-1311(+)
MCIRDRYYNGGVVGSTLVNLLCGALATHCMGLLLECRDSLADPSNPGPVPRTYGDIAARVHIHGRKVVQGMIVCSQIGFCCVYLSFIAGIFRSSFIIGSMSVTVQSVVVMSSVAAIAAPLTWIRSLHLFGLTNLIAMAIVFSAIGIIVAGSIYQLAEHGVAASVKWGVNENFLMFFGTSVYAFEGISMVLPIEAEMAQPHKMHTVMRSCMLIIVVFICTVGTIGYMAFGDGVQDIVLKNLSGLCTSQLCSDLVKLLVVLYCVSVLFTFPLMMVPVVKILENKIFSHAENDKDNLFWRKNLFRTGLVGLCLVVAIAANKSLEHFVSIIGSLACIPLAFVLPAWFHMEVVAVHMETRAARIGDLTIIVFGLVAMAVSFVASVASWAESPILLPV